MEKAPYWCTSLSNLAFGRREKIFGVPLLLQGAAKSCRGAPKKVGAENFFAGGGTQVRFATAGNPYTPPLKLVNDSFRLIGALFFEINGIFH